MAKIPTKEELEDFALNFDKNIEKPLIDAGYDSYNIFNILNIKRQELVHSDVLAFLFNPNQNDKINCNFLRNFLIMLIQSKQISEFAIEFFDVLYGTLKNVSVYREHPTPDGRIDILVDFEISKNQKSSQKVVIVIENKVDSEQHDNQLERYKNYIENISKYKGKEYQRIYLYLTPNKFDLVEDNQWKVIDYKFISQVLDRTNLENTDNSINTLIEDYKKIIRSEFMNETKAKETALKIYKSNQDILDFIFENRPNWIDESSEILCKLLEEKGAKLVIYNKDSELVQNKKRNQYLMFQTNELLSAGYKNHYFLIIIKYLSLEFRMNVSQKQTGTHPQKLFQDTERKIKEFQKNVISDIDQMKLDWRQVIDEAFKPHGIIQQWVDSLKNGGKNA
ncbi:MAG: PD-(D/E)XK nuclease family protein [Eubacteriales bacterium]|nr:PD-(D/E)XK nuclease family protein [Eubacteriales bacterium]